MLTKIKGLFSVKKGVSDKVFYSYFSKISKNKFSKEVSMKTKHYVSKVEGTYVEKNMEEKDMYLPYTSNSYFESNGSEEIAIPIGKQQFLSKEVLVTSEIQEGDINMVKNKGNITEVGMNEGLQKLNDQLLKDNEISIVNVDNNSISKEKIHKLNGKKIYYSDEDQTSKLNIKYFDEKYRD